MQAAVQALAGPLGGSRRGVCGRLHAQKAAQTAEETTGQEGYGHERVLNPVVGKGRKNSQQQDEDAGDHLVLPEQIGVGPVADMRGDLDHLLVALRGFHHLFVEDPGKDQGSDGADRGDPPQPRGSDDRWCLRPFGSHSDTA